MAAAAGAVKHGEEGKENSWQAFLDRATQKTRTPTATLVVLGDRKNGKGSLLRKLPKRFGSELGQEHLVEYSYLQVTNPFDADPDEIRGYVDVWEMGSPEQAAALLPKFVTPSQLKNTAYMITCDLSQPWNIKKSVDSWLGVLKAAHKQVFDQLKPADQEALRLRNSQYVQTFVDVSQRSAAPAAAVAALPQEVKVEAGVPKENLGVPLLLVGCKADALPAVITAQQTVGDRFEFITRYLRQLALDHGAATMFTSSAGEGKNVAELLAYLNHRLFGFELRVPSQPLASEENLHFFIAAGFDTPKLIEASKPPANRAFPPDATFETVFKPPAAASKKEASKGASEEVKAQDNEQFFKELKFTMEATMLKRQSLAAARPVEAKPAAAGAAPGAAAGAGGAAGSGAAAGAAAAGATATATAGSATAATATRPASLSNAAAPAGGGKDQAVVKEFFKSLLQPGDKKGGPAPNPAAVLAAAKDPKKAAAPPGK